MADTDLGQLERILEGFAEALTPRERKRLAMKIGQSLRRANAKRIGANRQPDGSAMAPRKPRKQRKKGKMFRNLRLARVLKVRPDPDGVEVNFSAKVDAVARVHHFALEDTVGRTRDGRKIRHRYERRELLGHGADDIENTLDLARAWLQEAL